ncbi:MAG: hypothetical protein ACTSPD_09630 [Promethearchaeota archaeon]
MENVDYGDIILLGKILRSSTCLAILNYLAQKDASNQEIYNKLKNKIGIEYRSTIFEALKRIKHAGLVEKYYDDGDNQIKYKLKYNRVSLDFSTMNLTMD